MKIQVRVVSKKVVKPCTPTPPNLKNYKLTFIDELLPTEKIGVLLFYGSPQRTTIINTLEESLAKVLVPFYPLAGRFRTKDGCIDCSDQGAQFVEAEAEAPPHVELATLILERDLQNLDGFMPCNNIHDQDEATYPILSIQITHLHCGGLVIGVAVAHKIFDAASLATFIAAWSSATNTAGVEASIIPVFDPAKLPPAKIIRNGNPESSECVENISRPRAPTTIAKRFAFNEEAIARLRSKLRPKVAGLPYSRVRVVCPFLAKCLIGVASLSRRLRRPCYIVQGINIRERTIPPLPKHACGNFTYCTCTEIIPEFPCPDRDMGIQELVELMSEGIDKGVAECGEMFSVGEDRLVKMIVEAIMKVGKASQSGEADVIWFTDWSKFGFYDVDFGWGKPVWASVVGTAQNGVVVLMGSREGNGVEAWVFLDKDDMALFEQDEEIRLLCNLPNN